jgi:hypothetical protein
MKRFVGMLAIVLGSSMFLYAQDKGKDKGTEMTGTICSSKCVKTNATPVACDLGCKEKGGDTVFVDDQGKVTKIVNPKKVKSQMGKKVKVKAAMVSDKDMEVYHSWSLGPG